MAKSRKRKVRKINPNPVMNERKFIKEKARLYPVETCLISKDYAFKGLAQCLVTRRVNPDKVILGCFLVDVFCLGVKNCIASVMDNMEAEKVISTIASTEPFKTCDWTLFQNIVYGAVEYAEDLGFAPQKDFAFGKYVLDDLDDLEYVEVEFGKDGKPFFVSGPFDNAERIRMTLDKAVGEGNYDFLINIDEEDWDDEDDDDWDDWDDEEEESKESIEYEIIEEEDSDKQ